MSFFQTTRKRPRSEPSGIVFFTRFLPPIIFFGAMAEIIVLLFDYKYSWVQPEPLVWRSYILMAHPTFGLSSLREAFNWDLMENHAPRLGRPGANVLEILDTYVRAWLFSHDIFIPSISITWIFTLILSPFLLYRGLLLLGIQHSYCWIGLCLYVSSPGILSLTAMSFRTGKALACFFYILLFYMALRVRDRALYQGHFVLVFVFILSLQFDEIAVFGLPIVFATLWPVRRRQIPLFVCLFIVTLGYFASVRYLLPHLYEAAGFPVIGEYVVNERIGSLGAKLLDTNALVQLLSSYASTIYSSLSDLTSATIFIEHRTLWAILPAAGLSIFCICVIHNFRSAPSREYWRSVKPYVAVFFLALCSHAILMSLVLQTPFGIYWYGVFICLPWTIVLMLMLQPHKPLPSKYIEGACIFAGLCLTLANIHLFQSTNNGFKTFHYYPYRAGQLSRMFSNEINRFDLFEAEKKTASEREGMKHFLAERCFSPATLGELRYITIEDTWKNSSDLAPQFIGTWRTAAGTAAILESADRRFMAVNERGDSSPVLISGDSITSGCWQVSARVSGDRQTLQWSNGLQWHR